jgi:hypothetical protein
MKPSSLKQPEALLFLSALFLKVLCRNSIIFLKIVACSKSHLTILKQINEFVNEPELPG